MTINDGCRATEIQIDAGWRQCCEPVRVVRQTHRIGAEELDSHQGAIRGARSREQLRRNPRIAAIRQQRIGHADKFCHAPVIAPGAREDGAQTTIKHAFHGRE